MPNSPLNPNFWLCQCPLPGNVHNSLFESKCSTCNASSSGQPCATQQQVNDHAYWVAEQQKLARNKKHELPQARKKEPPTREQFEAACDVLENWEKNHQKVLSEQPATWHPVLTRQYELARAASPEAFIIKRYKHHHAQNNIQQSSTGL